MHFPIEYPFFISLLFGSQLFYWFIGRRASKNSSSKDDYFLAGKSVKLFPLMMTFLATQVGGGLILGAAEEAYKFGWAVLFFPLGAALGLILLGLGVGCKLAQFQVSTVAQIFEVVYRSTMLKKVASLLSMISLFMILVAQIMASSKFLVSLGCSHPLYFILFWAIIMICTTQGGLRAVIATDGVQAAFFSIAFFLSFGFALSSSPSLQLSQWVNFAPVSSHLCGWICMPLLFMVIEQDMGQRCFAGASPKTVSKASLWAGVCLIGMCIVPVFFGSLAKTVGLAIPSGGSVLMTAVASFTNPWVTSLVGCAVLAAIVSTATSLINAISSNLSNDFKLSDHMRVTKGINALISVSAICFAFYFDQVVALMIQSYELSVSCLFIPLFIALFKKQGHFLAALISILCGALGFCLFRIYPIAFPKEIASILLSLLGYSCGEACTFIVDSAKRRRLS